MRAELDDGQKHYVRCMFRQRISGFVSPVWLSRLEEFSSESDSHIYLAVELSGPSIKTDYAIIEPADVSLRCLNVTA